MLDWNAIDTVLLDMDGTLLDLHFDNHFWREYVPQRYAEACGTSLSAAKAELLARYRDIEGSLAWYCVDHWTRELGLDIALLKEEVSHLIGVHPEVMDFLDLLGRADKRRVLVTNAHQKSLQLKLRRTDLGGRLDRIVCAHDLGLPKEHADFWPRLQHEEVFEPQRTLFVDDNRAVLLSAHRYGIAHLLAILKPDTCQTEQVIDDFPAVRGLSELLPGLRTTFAGR